MAGGRLRKDHPKDRGDINRSAEEGIAQENIAHIHGEQQIDHIQQTIAGAIVEEIELDMVLGILHGKPPSEMFFNTIIPFFSMCFQHGKAAEAEL